MAKSERPTRKTVSRCNPETERCTHVLEIAGYSLHKDVNPSCYIESATFAVGGHEWCIRFYPNGDGWEDTEGFEDSVSIYLVLMGEATEVRALFDFRMVGAATGVSTSVHAEDRVFSSDCPTWGAGNLMEKSELVASYLRDDRLVIECDVTVVMRTSVSQSEPIVCDIQVPPSVLVDDLGELLESEVGADVMFTVKSEVFHAHKIVLAMRSPVFMAELYGPMSDKEMKTITIEDMQPSVFKALLHFIYKDSLPLMDDLDTFEDEEMVKHLLVAADRYGIDRMKVMCESILGKRLCIGSVASTLALADQHHCIQLKDACIEFINSSNRSGDVFASQGYAHLKRACPAVIVEIWEKSAKTPRFILDT
ncbi:unnamed protein product [Urochloa decumbens]|uniref:Uncharacterized protein n=1 Tax=Urochloa decumbens TaxID=240449 RepID=A0ABC9C0Y7_9POAL